MDQHQSSYRFQWVCRKGQARPEWARSSVKPHRRSLLLFFFHPYSVLSKVTEYRTIHPKSHLSPTPMVKTGHHMSSPSHRKRNYDKCYLLSLIKNRKTKKKLGWKWEHQPEDSIEIWMALPRLLTWVLPTSTIITECFPTVVAFLFRDIVFHPSRSALQNKHRPQCALDVFPCLNQLQF